MFINALYKKLLMCLQLELQSTGPSTPSIIMDQEGNIIDSRDGSAEPIQFVFEDIHWTSEISRQEAARRLDVTLYPFKKVNIHKVFTQRNVCLNTAVFIVLTSAFMVLVVLLPRCPTCLFQKPLSELTQRRNWCIPFCFGEHWTTSPAEVGSLTCG